MAILTFGENFKCYYNNISKIDTYKFINLTMKIIYHKKIMLLSSPASPTLVPLYMIQTLFNSLFNTRRMVFKTSKFSSIILNLKILVQAPLYKMWILEYAFLVHTYKVVWRHHENCKPLSLFRLYVDQSVSTRSVILYCSHLESRPALHVRHTCDYVSKGLQTFREAYVITNILLTRVWYAWIGSWDNGKKISVRNTIFTK